jgi:hypothetical protein
MSEPQPSRVSVEVDRDADPISGQIQAPDGPWLPFVGWLGLISALERLIAPSQPAQPAPNNRQGES